MCYQSLSPNDNTYIYIYTHTYTPTSDQCLLIELGWTFGFLVFKSMCYSIRPWNIFYLSKSKSLRMMALSSHTISGWYTLQRDRHPWAVEVDMSSSSKQNFILCAWNFSRSLGQWMCIIFPHFFLFWGYHKIMTWLS